MAGNGRSNRGAGLRALPSVAAAVAAAREDGGTSLGEGALTAFVRRFLDGQREALVREGPRARGEIVEALLAELRAQERPRLAAVINATGIIVHTNLGRAPVSPRTAAAMAEAASSAVALEVESETGRRGGRMREVTELMRLLTGAEATLVVNNNAAAVLLTLSALAAGRAVVLSRGEAVEIGGGFRVPDLLRQSGARLVEVGTTNRTYAADYEAAIDGETAALLKVHPSNFRVVGFTHEASLAELAEVGRRHGVPVIDDQGSGALLDTARYGLAPAATIGGSLAAGASVVTASGDKLLGGPQAGIVAGRADLVERIGRYPLARAVRADKTCLAGVAATLRHFAAGEADLHIPVWRMIAATSGGLRERADRARAALEDRGVGAEVVATEATTGGGSLPGETLPSWALASAAPDGDVDGLADRLRRGRPGVYGRIEDGRMLLDLRTVLPEWDERLVEAVMEAVELGKTQGGMVERP